MTLETEGNCDTVTLGDCDTGNSRKLSVAICVSCVLENALSPSSELETVLSPSVFPVCMTASLA